MGEDANDYFAVPEKTGKSAVTDQMSQHNKIGNNEVSSSQKRYSTPIDADVGGSRNATSRTTPAMKKNSVDNTTSNKAFSLEEANEEIALLLQSGKVTQREVSSLQGMMRDHVALREKVSKLKSLLGRSAKAQREAKLELEGTTKRLDAALRENERLVAKVEHLANRPTHMDLLADFETNFDKALLSVARPSQQQSGGENTAPIVPNSTVSSQQDQLNQPQQQQQVVDSMLLQELSESQTRMERLENVNTALLHRSSQLERESKKLHQERDAALLQVERLTLDLRMSHFEAEKAHRFMQDKMQSLQEMQLEIDLVTKSSMDANVRAIRGEEAAKSVQTDREQVKQLQAQVQALQEWALASAESKRLCQERVRMLEGKVKTYESKEATNSGTVSNFGQRLMFMKTSSIVIGAGDEGFVVVELKEYAQQLKPGERVLLRWKFDITPAELSAEFNILKGNCDTPQKQVRADYIIKDRTVTGGAAGENESAFVVQNACTLLWSNKKSWVRPRAIKYDVEVFAIMD